MCFIFVARFLLFLYNGPATTHIYTLSLHDALPIFDEAGKPRTGAGGRDDPHRCGLHGNAEDRKSTRLNSSHRCISYAVFCLKKKKHYTLHHSFCKKFLTHVVFCDNKSVSVSCASTT